MLIMYIGIFVAISINCVLSKFSAEKVPTNIQNLKLKTENFMRWRS